MKFIYNMNSYKRYSRMSAISFLNFFEIGIDKLWNSIYNKSCRKDKYQFIINMKHADVAELVDAQDLKSCG